MKYAYIIKLVICGWMLVSVSCSSTPDMYVLHGGKRIDAAKLQSAVALAIVWEKYWLLGESQQQIESEASKPVIAWVSSSPAAELSVFLDSLGWRVDLVSDSFGNWNPCGVDRFVGTSAGHDCSDKITITISRDKIRQVCNPSDDFSETRQIVKSVIRRPDIEKFLAEYRESSSQKSKVWISPKVDGYNYIYYYVEGVPYLGRIEFDDHTYRVVHEDLLYIRETPRESDWQCLIDRLKKQGKTDEYLFKSSDMSKTNAQP